MKGRMLVTGLLALWCLLNIGCGISNSGSNNGASQTDVTNFVSTVAGSAVNALNAGAQAQGVSVPGLEGMADRILKSKSGGNNAKVKRQKMQVQCNSSGTSCTFSDNFNVSYTCQTGGSMEVAGTLTGNGTTNSAYLSMEIEVTPVSWTCDGPTVNGDPYVQINGTYTYPADSMTMTMSGGFLAGSQSCPLNVTVNGNSDGSGDISGTACGDSVSGSF
ncbi:MAG: hypothetical protein WB711_16925 [Terriglobales bacterium]